MEQGYKLRSLGRVLGFLQLFLLLIILISGVTSAQNYITLGTQAGTATNQGISPYNYYWESRRVQFVYLASELITAGATAGTITELAFDVSAINGGNLANYTIKMGHTSATDASSHNSATTTTVKNAHSLTPGSTGWRTIAFDANFEWNGTDNILVDVCWGVNSGYSSSGQIYLYNTATSNLMREVHSSSSNQCGVSTTTGANGKPRIRFTFLDASNQTFTSATTEQAVTTPVLVGSTNQPIIRLKVVTTGTASPIEITSVTFNTTGTTSAADVTSAVCYYSTTESFNTGESYGDPIIGPNGEMVFTGSKALASGANYFWLAYNISNSATQYNIVDGTCTNFETSEIETIRTPDVTDPAGSRTIRAAFNGTYTIANSGGNYSTLGAAVADLNLLGIAGPVIFNITSGQTFTESAPVSITQTGTAVNTITFQKSGGGANPIFNFTGTAATSDYAIQLLGSDYITFNGIEVHDAGTSSTDYVEYGFYFLAASATDGCQNNTVKNCSVDLSKANTSSKAVYLVSSSSSATTGANSTNYFYNNTVQDAYSAYYFVGASAAYNDGNKIGTIDGGASMIDNIGGGSSSVYALYMPYEKNFEFYGTTVSNVTASTTIYVYYNGLGSTAAQSIYNNTFHSISGSSSFSTVYGLYLTSGATYNIYGNVFTSMSAPYTIYPMYVSAGTTINVYQNKVHNITYSGSGSYIAYGIAILGGTTVNIYNNLIYDIKAPASTTNPGVRALSLTGGTTVNAYYNTVYLDYTATVASNQSAALYVGSTSPSTLLMKNNTFTNMTNVTTGTRAVAFYKAGTSLTNISASADYNHYYAGTASTKNLIYYDGTNADQTLTAYKTRLATKDQNAISGDPLLQAVTMKPFNSSPLVAAATPIAEVLTDIDGVTRNVTTPTIGAYENAVVPPGVDWCNLQFPGTHTKLEGVSGPVVYAQVYEPGVTEPAGQGAGIQCWIGYSTDNTNPNTWTNWIAATFHGQSGNNDEYKVTLPATLPAGTYYYASRFLLTGGMYQYGGFSGGFWDGTANVSGVLTVNDNYIWWGNLQFPATASITEGGSATIYGRTYVLDVTVSSDTSAAITAWVGVNPENTDPATWTADKWTRAFFNTHAVNNDEYSASIGKNLAPGTYYYATRYQFLNDPYVYGGYSTDGGRFWDGITYVSGTMSVTELIISSFPYFEGFEGGTVPPSAWSNTESKLWGRGTEAKSGSYSASASYSPAGTATLKSPAVQLPENMRISFWWKDDDITSGSSITINDELAQANGKPNSPKIIGQDTTYFEISTDNTNWTSLAILSAASYQTSYVRQICDLSAYANQTIHLRWRDRTNGSWDAYGVGLDNIIIEKIPAATSTTTIPSGNTTPTEFTGTGTTIQFTAANAGDLNLTVDKIGSNPGGTPPGSLQNIAPQYWSITVTSGTVNGTYSITFDITGVPGVNNPATLHLLKRDNASGAWTDLGVANSISGNLLTWTGLTSFSEFGIGSENDNPLPVQLSAFNVTTEARNALLNWETATEENAFKFVVEKKNTESATWSVAGEVKANGNSNSPKKYNYTDQKLNSGKYNYRLKMIDNDGTFTYSDVVEVDISVPKDYAVSQNYPNPFNPTTKIDYQLPFDSRVQIELYNITGERVATLVNMDQKAGYYTFDFTNTSHLSSGVYIYRIIATGASQDKPFTAVKKMVMMK